MFRVRQVRALLALRWGPCTHVHVGARSRTLRSVPGWRQSSSLVASVTLAVTAHTTTAVKAEPASTVATAAATSRSVKLDRADRFPDVYSPPPSPSPSPLSSQQNGMTLQQLEQEFVRSAATTSSAELVRMSEALSWAQCLRSGPCSAVLSTLLEHRRHKTALRLVRVWKRLGLQPSPALLGTTVTLYARMCYHQSMLEVLRDARDRGQLTVLLANIALTELARSRHMDPYADEVMALLAAPAPPSPSPSSFSSSCAAKPGAAPSASAPAAARPNLVTYNALMCGWAQCGRPEKVEAAYCALRAQGLPVTLFTLNNLLAAYARAGDAAGCARVLQELRERRLQPTLHTYQSLLVLSLRLGDDGRARAVLAAAEEVPGAPGDSLRYLYNTLLASVVRQQQAEAVVPLLRRMRARGVPGDAVTARTLRPLLGAAGAAAVLEAMPELRALLDATTAATDAAPADTREPVAGAEDPFSDDRADRGRIDHSTAGPRGGGTSPGRGSTSATECMELFASSRAVSSAAPRAGWPEQRPCA